MNEAGDEGSRGTAYEPAINAPWIVAALIGVLIGAHALRMVAGGDADQFALTSSDLAAGRFGGLVTYQFVHGSWAHVLMNSAFVLAFGAPVARFLGGGVRGTVAFVGFFLVCGAVAAVAYSASGALQALAGVAPGPWALVGASGAASGLMGAAARLIEGRGRLGPIFGRTVVGMSLSWIAVNLVLGVSGLTPGAAGAPVAWQAHIFGYFCGLFVIGPFRHLAGVKHDHAIAL
jgi:membrane associated rhomboid family serine protease